MDTPGQQDSALASVGTQSTSLTRGDDSGRAAKRNRNRYIAKACNECKRRKVKCNGQTPCQRCRKQSLGCIYFPERNSNEQSTHVQHLSLQITSLQQQISILSETLVALNAETLPSATHHPPGSPFPDRIWSPTSARRDSFRGPTTSNFSFDVAKSSLKQRGISEVDGVVNEPNVTQAPSPMPSPPSTCRGVETQQSRDPLRVIGKEEGLRLCHVYDEEMGMMYPVLEIEHMLNQVDILYASVRTAPLLRFSRESASGHAEGLDDNDVNILKMVFACALTAEAGGRSELAIRLFSSAKHAAEDHIWGPPGPKEMIFLMLVSILHFQMDEETLAWRLVGIIERMSLELGLHRHETLSKSWVTAVGPERAIKLFWSIYILDVRWSLGTGMPAALQDIDIDPLLPKPDESTPYLRVMAGYSQIAAKVWKFVAHFNNTNEIKKDEMAYLEWQLVQWVSSIPKLLKLDSENGIDAISPTRGIRRLQSLLYLRANQMRLLIYRPTLHTTWHINQYTVESDSAVEIAKDTIRFVTGLNKTSDIYRLQQVTFNWFLISALGVLFLAVAQAPSRFSSHCRNEFYMALELVKDFSTKSYISSRLWKSISSLKKLAPQVGLQKNRVLVTENDAPLTGSIAESLLTTNAPQNIQDWDVPEDFTPGGMQMSTELMNWFEAIGDFRNPIIPNNIPGMTTEAMGDLVTA
ncbi:hypothetical protein B0J14DRAFT_611602 [Halenospora varia]|nr:hypothetical protein B0J14DRAFT_611602 [Halenospora varia]